MQEQLEIIKFSLDMLQIDNCGLIEQRFAVTLMLQGIV